MTLRTTRRCAATLAVLLSLATPSVFALDFIGEEYGNAPVPGGPGLPFGLLSILNDTHRVYMYSVASDGYKSFMSGYFQGDTAAANDILRRFAALEKCLDVVLLPGPREVTGLDKRKVSADWELHIPVDGGRGRARRPVFETKPTLYLYVRASDRPAVVAAAAQVTRWLAELDAEAFETRERASGELEKQGSAVTAVLRKALEGKPPAEARRRIELLLAKLEGAPGVNLGVLTIPEGVRLLGPDDLLARNREALKSENVRVRAEVAELMNRFGPDPAALETQIQMLADKDAYPRQLAVRVLGRMGKTAAPALPALRAGLNDPIPYVRTDCKDAIAGIEAAKDEPGAAERAEKAKGAREEIGRFVKGRAGKVKE